MIIYVAIFAVALIGGWFANDFYRKKKIEKAIYESEDILKQANKDAEKKKNEIMFKAREERFKLRENLEKEYEERQERLEELEQNLQNQEKSLEDREINLNTKESQVVNRENEMAKFREDLDGKNEELNAIIIQQNKKLETISKLSLEDAKKLLLANIDHDTKLEAVRINKNIIDQAKENAVKQAKHILTEAIEKIASDHTVETTISVVNLASEDIKGRIIGRDGRNIKAFETLTGVKVIVDDTPEAVVLSGYDPVKRETARLALEKLIKNGKINPQRVEEMVRKSEKEMEQLVWKAGTEAVKKVGSDRVHPEIIKMLGRLRYRTSYGQNVLQHSKEVSFLTGIMAGELGLDAKLAKRAGLLHDIGKAIDFEQEGTHATLGAAFARKNGESEETVHAILAHHEDVKPQTIEAILVLVGDAISASRPGARMESMEAYIKRLEQLESLASSFDGVDKAYAIQSGREIRVMVKPEVVDDKLAAKLSRDIVKKIENELEYPGTIRVTLIRETRYQELAK